MEIKATLLHHLGDGESIYNWTAMLLDTETMKARRDAAVEDCWNMGELMERLDEYGGWLELKVDDPNGAWAQGAGQPDYTSANAWLIPAALVVDEELCARYDAEYGEGGYVVVTELDA